MNRINWNNKCQVLNVAHLLHKRLNKALSLRSLDSDELDLLASIVLFECGVIPFEDLSNMIRKYCGY